jgi:hypothetical protein
VLPGTQCELTGNRALFLAEVARLRSDSPFNMSHGFALFTIADDNPDVEFWGDDGGDGCTVGVCNVEHNGPTDDDYVVAPLAEQAAGEFDANNNIFDGGFGNAFNPLCVQPCNEDDFIGWVIAEARLDPSDYWCEDVDLDGDCDPGEAFSDDTFTRPTSGWQAWPTMNTITVQFFDEFGEVATSRPSISAG